MVAGGARAVFQLVGGALSDRFSPRTLMLVSNIVRSLVTAAITIVVICGVTQVWHLYLLSLIFGLVDAFFFPAYMSIVPLLVENEQLSAGNALLRGTARFMGLIGPAVAGVVIATKSLGTAFAIDTVTFVIAAGSIWLMKSSGSISSEHPAEDADREEGLFASIKAGLIYAWRHPLIRALLFFVAAIEFSFSGPLGVGLAAMAKGRFGGEATALGWMLSAFGGGMLLGMLVAGSIRSLRKRGRLVIEVMFFLGVGLALMGFVTRVIWASLVLTLIGLGGGLANIIILALLQSKTDKRMLGRVMGVVMFATAVLEPLSFALAGVLADENLTIVFVGGGAVVLVTSLFSLASAALIRAE